MVTFGDPLIKIRFKRNFKNKDTVKNKTVNNLNKYKLYRYVEYKWK